MKRVNAWNHSRKLLYLFWAGAFGLIKLFLNFLTHYYADDYVYMYSFLTGMRTENVLTFFPLCTSITFYHERPAYGPLLCPVVSHDAKIHL